MWVNIIHVFEFPLYFLCAIEKGLFAQVSHSSPNWFYCCFLSVCLFPLSWKKSCALKLCLKRVFLLHWKQTLYSTIYATHKLFILTHFFVDGNCLALIHFMLQICYELVLVFGTAYLGKVRNFEPTIFFIWKISAWLFWCSLLNRLQKKVT